MYKIMPSQIKGSFLSPVAYPYDILDWKNQYKGLHQPGDPGWLMHHYAGWGRESPLI